MSNLDENDYPLSTVMRPPALAWGIFGIDIKASHGDSLCTSDSSSSSTLTLADLSIIANMGISSCLVTLSAIIVTGAFALPAADSAPEAVPNFSLRSEDPSLSNLMPRAEAINFNQDYVASGANVQYSPNEGAGSFTVSYNTNADFVVGLGWQPGDSK